MVESTGLENRQPLIAVLGFKSLSLRHIKEAQPKGWAFCYLSFQTSHFYLNFSLFMLFDYIFCNLNFCRKSDAYVCYDIDQGHNFAL